MARASSLQFDQQCSGLGWRFGNPTSAVRRPLQLWAPTGAYVQVSQGRGCVRRPASEQARLCHSFSGSHDGTWLGALVSAGDGFPTCKALFCFVPQEKKKKKKHKSKQSSESDSDSSDSDSDGAQPASKRAKHSGKTSKAQKKKKKKHKKKTKE